MLQRSKTKKKNEREKTQRGVNKVKAIYKGFLHKKKQEISIYYDNKEIHAIKYCFWLCCAFRALYWHIRCKINWEKNI